MARRAKKPGAFNYKVGGISAKYYVVPFILFVAIYLLLPLPIGWYRGDLFIVPAVVFITGLATVVSFVNRLWRQLRKVF